MQHIQTCFQKYFIFSGRASRGEYWSFFFFTMITSLILSSLNAFHSFFLTLANIFLILTLIPSFAVMVRRLHDTNRSGWWFFLNLIPVLGNIAFFVFLLQGSHPVDNKWGKA